MPNLLVNKTDFILAGNINLDIIPTLPKMDDQTVHWSELLVPGRLIEIGAATISTGGSVSNTGIALSRLGFTAHLVSKIADDYFGQKIRTILDEQNTDLSSNLIISPSGSTSYTIVMSLPSTDRLFLHSPGVNDTFSEADIPYDRLDTYKIFHFGYPPLMRRMYAEQGKELVSIFKRVKESGLVTSLDMAKPDADSDAGAVDWRNILVQTLPYVDLFMPSFEEILFMLHPNLYHEFEQQWGRANVHLAIHSDLLHRLSEELLRMGSCIVAIKLGDKGLYLRTSEQTSRFANLMSKLNLNHTDWLGREMLAPCYQVEVKGTTGSGDCTIAGFLASLVRGLPPEQSLTSAVAVGAYSVEHADATSGIPAWPIIQERINTHWQRLPIPIDAIAPGWNLDEDHGLWCGPRDTNRQI